ncbi:hypothetical protein [Eisenbergiella sp.]
MKQKYATIYGECIYKQQKEADGKIGQIFADPYTKAAFAGGYGMENRSAAEIIPDRKPGI